MQDDGENHFSSCLFLRNVGKSRNLSPEILPCRALQPIRRRGIQAARTVARLGPPGEGLRSGLMPSLALPGLARPDPQSHTRISQRRIPSCEISTAFPELHYDRLQKDGCALWR